MRFSVTYENENAKTKSAKRKSIELLNSFLNFHLIEKISWLVIRMSFRQINR